MRVETGEEIIKEGRDKTSWGILLKKGNGLLIELQFEDPLWWEQNRTLDFIELCQISKTMVCMGERFNGTSGPGFHVHSALSNRSETAQSSGWCRVFPLSPAPTRLIRKPSCQDERL